MKIDSYACDQCGVQKKDANHWWKAYKHEYGDGVVIIKWNATPPTDPVQDFEAHLCGADCTTQWLSKNLF